MKIHVFSPFLTQIVSGKFLFLMKIIVFLAILVFFGLLKSEPLFLTWVSDSCFFFVCVLFQDVLLFCFFSACYLGLSHKIIFFALHFVFFLLFLLLLWYSVIFLNFGDLSKTISQKFGNSENPKHEKCRKKDILTRAVSTGVFTNSVFFFFFACL